MKYKMVNKDKRSINKKIDEIEHLLDPDSYESLDHMLSYWSASRDYLKALKIVNCPCLKEIKETEDDAMTSPMTGGYGCVKEECGLNMRNYSQNDSGILKHPVEDEELFHLKGSSGCGLITFGFVAYLYRKFRGDIKEMIENVKD